MHDTHEPELLETKLFAPRVRHATVPREQLLNRLDDGVRRTLTVIAAPAGFGKTTLLATWLQRTCRSVAWVSLDRDDNDARLFWTYVMTALQRVDSELGVRALPALGNTGAPPSRSALTRLINDIAGRQVACTLVLDDFHVIDDRNVLTSVEYLLENAPQNLHIILASRADPPLPLARLRGRGELLDLRAADLRFRNDEVAAFVQAQIGVELSNDDIAALEQRTEGWIAGLQLAALSLRDRAEPSEFIATFAGDDRYIIDYLVEEVLERQPPETRDFLLRTAILERMCGSLCDALAGDDRDNGQAMLEALERGNVFLTAVDDERHWYRYHQLFADVLRAHAARHYPDLLPTWHRRASGWLAAEGLRDEAIRHAFVAGDMSHAADLVERAWRPMDRQRRIPAWLRWASDLPESEVAHRPVLAAAYAWTLLEVGDLEAGETLLAQAERLAAAGRSLPNGGTVPPSQLRVADEDEYALIEPSLAGARAYLAMAQGDTPMAAKSARQALELLPPEAHSRRAAPGALLALAAWTNGELPQAAASLTAAIGSARQIGDHRFIVSASYVLGEILRAQGHFTDAERVYATALKGKQDYADDLIASTANLQIGRAELSILQHELDAAANALERAWELGDGTGQPHWRYRWFVAQAGLLAAQRDHPAAREALDQAEAAFDRGPVPDVRPLPAMRARLLLQMGQIREAAHGLGDSDVRPGGAVEYMREYEQLTLARLIIAQWRAGDAPHAPGAVLRVLDEIAGAARAAVRLPTEIEALALQALAHDALGDRQRAMDLLARALELAEPIGYVQVFLEESAPMRDLLVATTAAGSTGPLLQRIWTAFGGSREDSRQATAATEELAEPLTERELDVLRLIAAGLRNRDIADELYISLATVKRHIANAYGKLGVHSRTAAVARATELHLI